MQFFFFFFNEKNVALYLFSSWAIAVNPIKEHLDLITQPSSKYFTKLVFLACTYKLICLDQSMWSVKQQK